MTERLYCSNCGEGDHKTEGCPKIMALADAQKLAEASIKKLRGYEDPKAKEQAEMILVLLQNSEARNDDEKLMRELADTEGLVKNLVADIKEFADKCAKEEMLDPDWTLKMDGSVPPEEPDVRLLEDNADQALDSLPDEAK